MKLTADLIKHESESRINPLKDRELVLRGLNIPVIENLGATDDLNDAIDLTDNSLKSLGNFPRLKRLQRLLLAKNHISQIEPNIHEFLPNLTTVFLTDNAIEKFGDLAPLFLCKKVQHLSLLDNPLQKNYKQFYRLYLIYKLPNLRNLDFTKVKHQEREEAEKLFRDEDGTDNELAQSLAGESSSALDLGPGAGRQKRSLTEEEQIKIKNQLKQATSIEEINRLEQQLEAGQQL